MDRHTKEMHRRRAEARRGLSPEEVAALDAREAEEAAIHERAHPLHVRLFPEEHDYVYDSASDAKLRASGTSPMSADYIARTNARRIALGFAPYPGDDDPRPKDTMGWVRQMLRDGRGDELEEILKVRDAEDQATKPAVQLDPKGAAVIAEIDKAMESDRFLKPGQDRNAPQVVAERLLGCVFDLEAQGTKISEKAYLWHLRRLCPDLPEDDYAALRRAALDVWTAAYGYE
jgi:hypothetical protein